ncbi:UDP-N-acetylmuramate--L-alanine ligase [Arthrobacter castelli]|uniref:UDP-N-acetylmuramate--L-alanine ligase n=1 Tax=Arthrobacter castelli TaxID=271431 RepID=UPI00040FEB92|nr:UDP-N-acetylmuramate--L-alanine ligase [Arthrobacter castelli]
MRYSSTPSAEELGNVHFVGIGGAGMSAIARILLARSVTVSGSDARDSEILAQLGSLGATVHAGHNAEWAGSADTVVVSTAIRSDNPEVRAATAAGARVIHRSQALAAAMDGKSVVAVAGTHGKTTTTAMITVMLHHNGLDPSFAVGGDVAGLSVNAAHGSGDWFIAEADESDGSFLNYRPNVAVVTNVEPDHLDHYGSPEAVYAAFDSFVDRLAPGGTLIACADDGGAGALVERLRERARDGRAAAEWAGDDRGGGGGIRVLTYGFSESSTVRIVSSESWDRTSTAVLEFGDGGTVRRQELVLAVPGTHNILNAAAAFAAGLQAGLTADAAAEGLSAFSGAARRFEFKGEAGGVRVFDDYAHHPTEVLAALTAARTVAGPGRVHVLFQPHLFSRTKEFAVGFADALSAADSATVMDIYPAREDPMEGVTSELITGRLAGRCYQPDLQRALDRVVSMASCGDIVLTVGAGDVTQYGPLILNRLEGGTVGNDQGD